MRSFTLRLVLWAPLLALPLLATPLGAESAGEPYPLGIDSPSTFRIPAGGYQVLTYDSERRGFAEIRARHEAESVFPRGKDLPNRRIPAWLQEDVLEQLERLRRAPLRVARGPASVVFADVTGDGRDDLIAVDADGKPSAWGGPDWVSVVKIDPAKLPADRHDPSIPARGDIDGDGLRDVVFGAKDGSIRWWRSRGVPGVHSTLEFHREPDRFFRHDAGTASRPAAWGRIVMLGSLSGDLLTFERNSTGGWEATVLSGGSAPVGGLFSAPTLGDLDADGRPDIVLGTQDGSLDTNDLTAGTFSSPCLVDLDRDGDLDILCGNRDGKILCFRNTGTPEEPKFVADTSDANLAALDVGDSSAPAAGDVDGDGDVDLIVGNQAGELRLFLGPDWTEDPRTFEGLDVGELAAPALMLDEKGRVGSGLGLLVGRLDGDVLYYVGESTPDGVRFTETLSWSFNPEQTAKTLEDYYRRNYFPEAEEVRGANDPETHDAYVRLLREAPDAHVDEVAFAIARSPAEVLRAMHRLGQSGLLLENAKAIYEMAEKVSYARIVEKGENTTIAYARGPDDWVEAPRDVYYWWVVHPRLLFEIPCRVDATWWETLAKERGLTDSKWWTHELKPGIHVPSPKGVFWRPRIAEDDRFGSRLVDRAAPAKTLRAAIEEVSAFVSHGPGLMRFGYETQDLQPWLIYAKHYGSCGEHSIIGAACARTMLIPTSIVGCRGEDHQWNEWWGTDGEWHQWDACNGGTDNPYYEGRQHQGKTISTISRWWGNDRLDATTTTVYNPPEFAYTETGRGYTDVADVRVRVEDAAGEPLDGALVILRSHWDNRNLVTLWGHTDGHGRARFGLGYEPNGGYTIEALTPFGSAGVRSYTVAENESYELVLRTPKAKPGWMRLDGVGEPEPSRPRPTEELTARLVRARIRPPSPLTSSRYRIGSYMTDAHDYRGTRGYPVDVDPGELPEVLVFSPEEFEKFERGTVCTPMHRGGFGADGRARWPFWRDRAHVVVLSNLRAVWTEVAIEVEAQPGGPDRVSPTVRIVAEELTGPRGTVFDVGGEVKDDVALESVRIHCSAWPDDRSVVAIVDPETGEFTARIDTGAGGPWPAGMYTVFAVARDTSGNETRSAPVSFLLPESGHFTAQKIRQDDPDDPLSGDVWTYGPFDLDGSDRFLLIRTKSLAEGFDCDVHLYRDENGNGRIDGNHEKVKSSTSPTATERIYNEKPPAGTYWLRCQGWKVEGEFAPLDVEIHPTGTARAVVDLAPVGRLGAMPERLRARFLPFAVVDPETVRVTLDGRDVTRVCRIDRAGFEAALPPGLVENAPHTVVVRVMHRSGREETRTFSFEVDTRAPELEILSPKVDSDVKEKVRLEVAVTDASERVAVFVRIADEKERKLKKVKGRPGVRAVEIDAKAWSEGEHFVWLVARDGVGNVAERVLRLRKPESE